MKMKSKILALLTVVFCFSCTKESNVYDQEIEIILSSFEEEALNRDLDIQIADSHITFSIEPIEGNILGQCKTYSNDTREIIIDDEYWTSSSALDKEYILFHELGHCVLNREHNNEKDENGSCISIMQSGNMGCIKRYNSITREDLIDELFQN